MIRGRTKRMAIAAGASLLVAAGSLAIIPLTASAAGTAPTATTVTTHPGSTTSGQPLTIVAKVAPVTGNADTVAARSFRFRFRHGARAATGNAGVPTGTVTFTITGSNSSVVNCKTTTKVVENVATISAAGKATCSIPDEALEAVASPYSIAAVYSGDDNFAGSTGNATEDVARAKTHTKVKVDSRPTSDTANTFTAHIEAGPGSSLVGGTVNFSVAATPRTAKSLRTCAGGDVQPVAVTGNVATATCTLTSGWFVVRPPTKKTPHPHGSWNVSASYSGDGNFLPSFGSKSGRSSM
jgi:hypothetical protein